MNRFKQIPTRTKGILYMLSAIIIYGGWMVVSRHSTHGELSAFDISALRFGTAGLIMLPVFIRKGLKIGPYGIFGGVMLALLMGATFNMTALYGMRFAPASHAAGIINTTMLVLSTISGIFILKEKTTKLRILGIVICIIGVTCLLEAKSSNSHEDMFFGHILFLMAGFMWSIYVLLMKKWKAEPVHATAAVCCVSAILFLPVYFAFIPSHISMGNLNEVVFQAFYQGVLTSVVALIFYNRGIECLGASTSSAFIPLVPVLATLIAIPALGEIPNTMELSGVAIAGLGVLLAIGIVDRFINKRRNRNLTT